jgi:hypothetical protein
MRAGFHSHRLYRTPGNVKRVIHVFLASDHAPSSWTPQMYSNNRLPASSN